MDVLEHEKSACSARHLQYLAIHSVDSCVRSKLSSLEEQICRIYSGKEDNGTLCIAWVACQQQSGSIA